jgi:hypothetical protein
MASNSRNAGNSFSELLDANREQLERLYSSVNIESSRPGSKPSSGEVSVVRLSDDAREHLGDPIEWLEQHYAGMWRHEIRDRRVEDDEMLVLVRLELPALGIRKSQFGRAPVNERSGRPLDLGQKGGIGEERQACDAAVRDALRRCIELF